MLARVGLAAVAVLALAYLSIGLRSVVLTERAQEIAALPNPSPAQVDEAERLFERARLLDPDTRPLLLEGALLAGAGSRAEGGCWSSGRWSESRTMCSRGACSPRSPVRRIRRAPERPRPVGGS